MTTLWGSPFDGCWSSKLGEATSDSAFVAPALEAPSTNPIHIVIYNYGPATVYVAPGAHPELDTWTPLQGIPVAAGAEFRIDSNYGVWCFADPDADEVSLPVWGEGYTGKAVITYLTTTR